MGYHQPDAVRYFTFDSLENEPLVHAVFTRVGGVSEGQWESLNMGLTQGDVPERVMENRRLSFEEMGRKHETLSDSWLVHETGVLVYDAPRPVEQPHPPQADIILTDKPEVTLFMRFADCVPVLLYDPVKKAIGLAHAGWMGTVKQVGRAAVEAMGARYGSRPEDLITAIGPSIGPEKYEVGPEVVSQVREAFGADAEALLPRYNTSIHFNLWAANQLVLSQAGVRRIELAELCTASDTENWFSHRAEKGKTGRFGALLGLKT